MVKKKTKLKKRIEEEGRWFLWQRQEKEIKCGSGRKKNTIQGIIMGLCEFSKVGKFCFL